MNDIRVLFGIGAFLLIVGTVVLFFLARQPSSPPNVTKGHSPGERLHALASERRDYKLFVGVPLADPSHWVAISRVDKRSAYSEGGDSFALADVRAFLVTYSAGQIVDCEPCGLRPPTGVVGLDVGRIAVSDVLTLHDLKNGQRYVRVKYGVSTSRPNSRDHYSTTLTNVSRQRIRVLRFAGYHKTPEGYELSTVTGAFFSAQDFREWYGLGRKEWIEPGDSAADTNNYGSPPVLWAYYCKAEDGTEFIAGAVRQ